MLNTSSHGNHTRFEVRFSTPLFLWEWGCTLLGVLALLKPFQLKLGTRMPSVVVIKPASSVLG
ncbi:MAG: hypothetical protein ACO3A2_09515 [Bdellovibrionia bacterium]